MVQLHAKVSEEQHFLASVPATSSAEEATQILVAISNLVTCCARLCKLGEQVVSGQSLDAEQSNNVSRAISGAQMVFAKDQIQKGCCLTADQLRHTLGDLRAHLQPLCDQASSGPDLRAVLDVAAALDNHDARPQDADPDLVLLDPCSAEVWFAGKRLRPGSKLAERMGRNEKTKAVVRLMPAGHGAPPREQALDSDTQKAMMAWYHKKQQQEQKLAADNYDYSNSDWASPKNLKSTLHGMGSVSWH